MLEYVSQPRKSSAMLPGFRCAFLLSYIVKGNGLKYWLKAVHAMQPHKFPTFNLANRTPDDKQNRSYGQRLFLRGPPLRFGCARGAS